MSKTIFYKKSGRRYVPVSEYDNELMDAFTKGTHLVQVYPGGSSRRYNIDPNYAAMIAAGRVAEDAISKVIMERSALRHKQNQALTNEQQEAWKAFNRAMGDDRYALEWCSYREAAEAGVSAMIQEAEKLLENPSVRKAFERFLLVAELTKDHQHQESK